ncbi:sigma-70 family RNA polymerase sigma factor [Microaerobacter geothermalis]|uniref:RNA polymerase sigma factor n=1 Tax=Microaerobacter geothermalis TaxID=674972 RepID=UPI001F1F6EB6|nr:sigma-70 family RNA polymerase sigma factor [Microaerobacter geothermalis]MCF6092875.1 sigma-70 family RNA polymerase sigma factor [Microaerobacter geothermalis]
MVDIKLVRSAQKGNRDDLIQLLREVETTVYRTAYYLLGNEQDALDAAQESLIRIYTKIPLYREEAKFETWVQRIVTNICIDRFRRNKNMEMLPIENQEHKLAGKDNVEDEMELLGMAEDLKEAINQLPDHHRTVVVLRYIQDFSYHEISETLNIPLNTVKSYLFRGRQQLQELLRDYQKGGVQG